MPRAPLPARGVTSHGMASRTMSEGITPLSQLLRAHAPDHHPPPEFRAPHLYPVVFAGYCQPLLGDGLSRRSLRASFPACLDPYPGASPGAHTRSCPGDIGLHRLRTGSASHSIRTATSVRGRFRGCSHSLMCRPAGLLATQVAPTAVLPLGSRGFSVRAYCGLFPLRTSDMLAVRIGQLTAWGLAPHKIRGLAGCSPEALPYPILKCMSSTSQSRPKPCSAALHLAPGCSGGAVAARCAVRKSPR
jgi:hypothetical protein